MKQPLSVVADIVSPNFCAKALFCAVFINIDKSKVTINIGFLPVHLLGAEFSLCHCEGRCEFDILH